MYTEYLEQKKATVDKEKNLVYFVLFGELWGYTK